MERYKDISVDLKSLLDDAVEHYGRFDTQQEKDERLDQSDAEMDDDQSMVKFETSEPNLPC